MNRWILAAPAVLVLAGCGGSGGSSSAPAPTVTDEMVFVKRAGGFQHLFYFRVVDGVAQSPAQFTGGGRDHIEPVVTSDGRTVYFTMRQPTATGFDLGIYRQRIAVPAEAPVAVADDVNANESQPFLSPDGSRLVFKRQTAGDPGAIIELNLADGTTRNLTSAPEFATTEESGPAFNPNDNGATVAFTSRRGVGPETEDAYVVTRDSLTIQRLTNDSVQDQRVRFQIGGPGIVWTRGAAGARQIWRQTDSGSAPGPIGFGVPGESFDASFTLSGMDIVFVERRSATENQVWIGSYSGGSPRLVLAPAEAQGQPFMMRPRT